MSNALPLLPALPYLAGVEPTNHCPYTCVACPKGEGLMQRELGWIGLPTLRRALAHRPPHQRLLRLYQFGESVLHPRIGDIVEEVAAAGLLPMLSLNPASLDERRIDVLARSGLAVAWLSVDSFTDAGQRALRGIRTPAARCAELLDAFLRATRGSHRRAPMLKIVQMVGLAANAEERVALAALKRRWPGPDVQVHVIDNHGWGDAARVAATSPGGEHRLRATARSCHAPFDEVTVLWNGDVVPCCFDYDGSNVLGNVDETPLPDIWRGARARELRERFRARNTSGLPLCGTCELAPHRVPVDRPLYVHKGLTEERMILQAYDALAPVDTSGRSVRADG